MALLAVCGMERAMAGTFNANFDDGNTPSGANIYGSAYVTNTTGVAGSGALHLTDNVGSQQGSMVLDDLDSGANITGFTADFDIYLGDGSSPPADGFSFCFGPDITDGAFGEEGSGTGLIVEFDTYDNGAPDHIGVDIKLGGDEIAANTSFDNSHMQQSKWVHCTIQANNDGTLNVAYNNEIVFTNVPGAFPAQQGRFGLGGRTGGAWENLWIDNLKITTINTLPQHPYLSSATPAPNSAGVSPQPTLTLNLTDTATQVAQSSIALLFNGTKVTPTIAKNGSVTTITYSPANLLPGGSTNTVTLAYSDNGTPVYTNAITYTLTIAPYADIDASFALTDAEATAAKAKPGFYVQLWGLDYTSQVFPNDNAFSEYALFGELGPNAGDLATGSYTDNSQLVPNLRDESATIDYASGAVPGVPTLAKGSANYSSAPTDNFAMAFYTAIQFDKPGLYTLGVNSDDGFRTYIGTNLVDRFQWGNVMAGEFNGGRGTADTLYTFNIQKAGLYPFRTTYEEGGGGYAVHWFSVNSDGSHSILNDSADSKALKTYQWIAQKRAFIKSISPGANEPFGLAYASPDSTLNNGVTVVVGDGSLTKYVAGSAKMIWDGQDVTSSLKATSAGGATTINYPTTLVRATQHSVTFMYDESSTPPTTRTNSFVINVAGPQMSDLPASSFWIEAEDFDNKGATVAAASTMPYLGGAFDGMPATWGVDYNNNDAFETTALYRDEASPDLGTSGKSVDIVSNLGQRWGTTRPGGTEMTVNYRIGWIDSGEWGDYTRTIPAGVYTAYAGLSYGDFSGNSMGATLSLVTAGAGTSTQTLQTLGVMDSDGSGGWGQNSLVPMHSGVGGSRTKGYFKLPGGQTTLRMTVRSGDYDFFILAPETGVPPQVVSAPADTPRAPYNGSVPLSDGLQIVVQDLSTTVSASSIKLTVDGTDQTSKAQISKSGDLTTIKLGGLALGSHAYSLAYSDTGTPPQNLTFSRTFTLDPRGSAGQFLIEAEDFDHDGGKSEAAASTMPYTGGAYAGLGGVAKVDYNNDDGTDSPLYRDKNLNPHVNMDAGPGDFNRGSWTQTVNYKIGWIGDPDWQNYTRTIPDNTYNIYAALSYDDFNTPHRLTGKVSLVTAGQGTTNQTLSDLGTFDAPGTGGWGVNNLVPAMDASGNIAAVKLSGTQTLRITPTSGDNDYYLLVPATGGGGGPPPTSPQITSVSVSANTLTIVWTGGGSLQTSADLKTWSEVPSSSGGTYTTAASSTHAFYRVKK